MHRQRNRSWFCSRAEPPTSTRRARSRRAGFTLVEMMMVVAIVGILAAISIPTYTSYLYRSRTTEAIGFLADIKARQEAYKAEYFQYCSVSADQNDYWPAGTLGPTKQTWAPAPAGWAQLGVTPPGPQVQFAYMTLAGNPGTTPPGTLGYDGSDFWFISRAKADLDGDGVQVMFESLSHRQELYIDQEKGWE